VQLAYAIVGAGVGVVVGVTSTGGGALLTPALLLLGVPPSISIGSDVLVASGMKLFGGGAYAFRRQVHWPTVWRLAAGSVPGAALGIAILNRIPKQSLDSILRQGLGGVLVLAGVATLVRLLVRRGVEGKAMPGTAITVALGFVTGLLVSTTSIGSGSLLLCVLALFFPLAPQTMVGTDLAHALILSVVATIGHVAAGRVDWSVSAALLTGAIPGVLAGARLADAVPQRVLRAGLALVLIGIGAQLSLFRSAAHRPVVAPVDGERR